MITNLFDKYAAPNSIVGIAQCLKFVSVVALCCFHLCDTSVECIYHSMGLKYHLTDNYLSKVLLLLLHLL